MEKVIEIILGISAGNMGAASVCMKLLEKNEQQFLELCDKMIDKNLKGENVWQLYKNKCGKDLDKFIEKVME